MLLAYLDEIGSTGAFVHPTHPKFADSPSFGYGGFIIPEGNARQFGAFFAAQKKQHFKNEIPEGTDPGRWEKKGSDLLYAKVHQERPQNLRLLSTLISKLRQPKIMFKERPIIEKGSMGEANRKKLEQVLQATLKK